MSCLSKFNRVTDNFFGKYNFNIEYEVRNYYYSLNYDTIDSLDLYIGVRRDKSKIFKNILNDYINELIIKFNTICIEKIRDMEGFYHLRLKDIR